jgi:aspartokinase
MYPWLWFWPPQLHFPWSGSVAQRISTELFDLIQPGAGDSNVERKAFEVASYGKQIGLITEVLLGVADKGAIDLKHYEESLHRLKEIQATIDRLKDYEAAVSAYQIVEQLEKLRKQSPEEYERIVSRLERISSGYTSRAAPGTG